MVEVRWLGPQTLECPSLEAVFTVVSEAVVLANLCKAVNVRND